MDNYQEIEIRGEYQFSPQLVAYAGYRNNSADYNVPNGENRELYDGMMFGAQFKF